jgi:hypothetical protein
MFIQTAKLAGRCVTDLISDYRYWLAICLAERASGLSVACLEKLVGEKAANEIASNLEDLEVVERKSDKLHLVE